MLNFEFSFFAAAIYPLLSSFILILFSFFCAKVSCSYLSPSFVFSFVWGVALFLLSCGQFFNFYPISSNALIIFVLGALTFSMTSIFFERILARIQFNVSNQMILIDFKMLLIVYVAITILIMPIVALDVLKFGSTIPEIAYNIRYSAIHGESIASIYSTFYFVFSLFVSVIFIYALINKRLNFFIVVVSLLPFLAALLIMNGRSGIISLILSWFFVYLFYGGKLNFKSTLAFVVVSYLVLFFGATLVGKFNVDGLNFFESLFVLLEHIMDYLLQGPLLFARYFDGDINVRENWDTLNIACHIISKFGWCEPLPQHQDTAYYGINKIGNVYSLYFSLFPHYSYVGMVFFLVLYSTLTTFFFKMAKCGNVFSVVISGNLFSVMILSLFKDGFGYSILLFIEFLIISVFFVVFFVKSERINTRCD